MRKDHYNEAEYDIRRSCKIKRKISAKEIIRALNNVENLIYSQKIIRDIDGKKTYSIGLAGKYLYDHIEIRTGENLENNEIELNGNYEKLGVASVSCMQWGPGRLLPRGYCEDNVIEIVELVRDKLEEILKN